MSCRNCGHGNVNRPRGLCWSCYYRAGVRDLYPSTHPKGMRGLALGNRSSRPLPRPTDARPGTPEKLAELAARAERGELLFHPADA